MTIAVTSLCARSCEAALGADLLVGSYRDYSYHIRSRETCKWIRRPHLQSAQGQLLAVFLQFERSTAILRRLEDTPPSPLLLSLAQDGGVARLSSHAKVGLLTQHYHVRPGRSRMQCR